MLDLVCATGWRVTLGWLLSGLCAAAHAASSPADLVLRHGAVYTVDAKRPWAEALAVKAGRVVAIGRDADVAAYIGPSTQVVDLQGRMLMPGVNDVHAHPIDGAYEELFSCSLPPEGDLAAVLGAVKRCVQQAQPGEWIVGAPYSSAIAPALEKRAALDALDAASAGHPVVLRDDSFHNRWVNSEVLQRAGIGPGAVAPPGGVYVFDQGQPTGLLKEFAAFDKVQQLVPPRTPERLLQAAQTAASQLNAFGITAVQDAWVNRIYLDAWHRADRSPQGLSLRVVTSLAGAKGSTDAEPGGLPLYEAAQALRSDRVRPDFVKFFLDGVPMAYTAAFLAPYQPSLEHGAHFHGHAHYTLAQLVDQLVALDKRGIGVKLHSVGDGAVRLALDAIAEVRRRNGMKGPQHQIAHVSWVAASDMPRFKRLNVVADASPMLWFPTPLTPLIDRAIGPKRTQQGYPIGSLMRAGAPLAVGSDWPAGQPTANPWIGIEGLVTRRNPLGQAPGMAGPANERLNLAQALRLYTRDSAAAMRLGAITGSLEVGKSADFIELDQHLFLVPVQQIHKTRVLRTWLEGRLVHEAAAVTTNEGTSR